MSRKNHQRPCTKAATASIPWAKQSWQPQFMKTAYAINNSIRRATARGKVTHGRRPTDLKPWSQAQEYRLYVCYELNEARHFGSTRTRLAVLRHLRPFTKLAATVLP